MKKRLVVVATNDESRLTNGCVGLVTGVGALNVIRNLAPIDRNTSILNVGYAGSNSIPVGTRVRVGKSCSYHPNVEFEEPTYQLDGDVTCYTSSDFVTETDVSEPCVFDMELAYILAMGFTDVVSEKVVSDNLSMGEYERNVGEDANG